MITLKLTTLIAFVAFWMSFSGVQADAYVGRNNLNNNNNNNNLKCVAECTRDLKFKRGVNSNAVCARAKEVKLGLTPYHACLRGMDNAFTQICTADCATTSDAKTLLMKSSDEACKNWKSGMRERFQWCKHGYNQSWEKLTSVISRINEEKSVEVGESVKELTDTNQHSDISPAQGLVQVDHAVEERLGSKVEELGGELVDESVEELVDTSDMSGVDHAMKEPFKYEVEESVGVGEVHKTWNVSQAQLLVEEVDHAVEVQLESTSEEPVDNSDKYLACSVKHFVQEAKLLVQEFEQTKEEQYQIEDEFEALRRNTDLGSTAVQESVVGLNNSYACVHGTTRTQSKGITSGTKHSPALHGVARAEAIAYFKCFTGNKATTGMGHFYAPDSEWSRRYICSLGSGNNHSTALHLKTMGEVDTNYVWNIASAHLSCIRTEVAVHMWHPRHKLFANCDDDGGGANILAAQSGVIFQFIDSGPSDHASSSKPVTWEVHLFWVTRLSIGDLLLLKPSLDITLRQMNVFGYPWQHLNLPVRQRVEQKRMDFTKYSQQSVEPEPTIAFTSHELISAAEVILYFEPQLGFGLRGRASPISMKIIASLDWIQDDAIDLQLILNHQFSSDAASSVRCCLLRYSQLSNQQFTSRERKVLRRDGIQLIATALEPNQIILLPRTHMFTETNAYATQAQVLYIATMSASKYETKNGECQSFYRENYGYGLSDLVDPLVFESSKITAQPLQLQSSLRRLSHAWLTMSRHMTLDSLSSRAPNITARNMNSDEGESFHSGGFDRTHAQFSPYEVFRLYLNVPTLSDQVTSDADSITIASMYQTGWDDYHLKRDALNMGYFSLVVALFLLVLRCYDIRADILEALKESFIEWEFQQWQQAKCIASQLNTIDIIWIASRILANKAQQWKSKFELGRLYFESGLCWRNRPRLLRFGTAFEESSKMRRMMQRKSRSRLRSRVSVGCLCPDGVIGISFLVYCSVVTLSIFRFSLGQRAGGRVCSSSSLLFTNAFNVALSLLLSTFRVQASYLQR